MPAACAFSPQASAAVRRRSFEEFLGVHESFSQKPAARLRRRHHVGVDCRDAALGVLNCCNSDPTIVQPWDIHFSKQVWPTSFKEVSNSTDETLEIDKEHHDEPVHHAVSEQEAAGFELTWQSAAIITGVAVISAGAGFAAAMMARPATGDEEQPAPVEDEIPAPTMGGTQPTADTSIPTGAQASSSTAGITAPQATQEATDPPEPSPEELARQQRIAELEEQRKTMMERKQELEARREEVTREFAPDLEKVNTDMSEIDLQIAAERAGVDDPLSMADQEVMQDARQADVEARAQISGVYDQIIPLVLQGQRVQTILDARINAVRERVPAIVTEELNEGLGELTSALESVVPGIGNVARMDDLPALSLMIAGLAAPTQLNMLHSENIARLGFSAALLAMDLVAVGAGYNMKCITFIFDLHGSFLRPWMAVDAFSIALTVLIRLMAKSSVNRTMEEMKRFQEEPIDIPSEPTGAFRVQLERQLLVGAQAMLQYDRLANSWSFKILDVLPAFDFVWQIAGIALLFDTPSQFCKAQILMYWSRMRGVIFLIGMLPTLIALALVILKAAVSSQSTCMAVLKAAREADKYMFPNGPPVVTLLVRAFLVRDTTDMASMELQILEFEKRIAQAQHDKLKKEYDDAAAELKKHKEEYDEKSKLLKVKTREEEFLQQYRQNVSSVVGTMQLVQDPQVFAEQAASEFRANLQAVAQQHAATHPPAPLISDAVDEDDGDGGTGSSRPLVGLGQLQGALGSVGLPITPEQAMQEASSLAQVGQMGLSSALSSTQPPVPPREGGGEGGSGT